MLLDIIGVIFIALFFSRGYSRGLIVAVFTVLSILLGVLCALALSSAFAKWLLKNHYTSSAWAPIIAYLLVFMGVVILVRFLARAIQNAAKDTGLGTINMLIGGALYGFMGAVIWSSLLWIGSRAGIITHHAIATSRTYHPLSKLAPWFFAEAGKLLPFAKSTFADLEHFFNAVKAKVDS